MSLHEYENCAPRRSDGALARRVLSIATYAAELRDGVKLTSAQCLKLFGSSTPPIPVPLRLGESEAMYEERFCRWMHDQNRTLMPLNERNFRTAFAQIQAHYYDPKNIPFPSHAPRGVEKYGPQAQEVASSARQKRARRSDALYYDHHAEPDTCSAVLSDDASSALKIRAFIRCGCSKCQHQGEHLVLELQEKLRTYESHDAAVSVIDLTEDEATPRSVAEAISSLVCEDRTKDFLLDEARVPADNEEFEDTVEERLLREYDRINEELVVNQGVLESSAAQVRGNDAVTSLQELISLQSDNQELHDVIQGELKHRNAALAMVIAYTWRNNSLKLETLLNDDRAGNSPHVQQALHVNLDRILKHERVVRANMEQVKIQSDKILDCRAADRSESLRQMGAELGQCEHQLRKLRAERMQDMENLIMFDKSLRVMIRTLLTRASG